MLFSKLLPRDADFFEMFNRHADRIVEASQAFTQLVQNYDNLTLREKYTLDVDKAESAADRITHEIMGVDHSRQRICGGSGLRLEFDALLKP